jgi:trigger factor
VRLGLVLAEIGKRADVQVPEQDMNHAVQLQAMQAGVPVQRVIEFYRENPTAWAQLRAPLYEDRVIDHIIGKAEVTDKPVSRAELMTEPGEL